MLYQDKFDLTEGNSEYFCSQFDILIKGNGDISDSRHIYFRNSLKEFKGKVYSLDTCENAEKFAYKIETHDGIEIEVRQGKSLIPDLARFLKEKEFAGAKICLDITTLKQGILFLLIKLLTTEIKPSLLFAGYTEPTDYIKKEGIQIGNNEEFDLYDRIIGNSRSVPGFIKYQSSRPVLLVAPMGFDSQRLQTIYESIKPEILIPVLGFPSFVPGWNLTAIKMNYKVLKSSNCTDVVETCEAASPFELMKLINGIYERYITTHDIYVSPLGTRPHCLGAALFASQHSNVYLIYDFPVEKKVRSENILKANIYNISKYIN